MTESKPPLDSAGLQDSSSIVSAELLAKEVASGETGSMTGAGEASIDRHPVDIMAEEFCARLRAGETLSVEEYENRAPTHGSLIRELFPTIALVERMTQRERSQRRSDHGPAFDRANIGDFRIVRELGRGGMGVVYEAVQCSLGRHVALKVLGAGIANSPQQLQRFRREAESAARLHHTNIVPVYGIGAEEGIHFYAMQLIDGIPLVDAIATVRHRSSVTHLSKSGDQAPFLRDHLEDSGKASPIAGPDHGHVPGSDDPTVLMQIDPESDTASHASDSSGEHAQKAVGQMDGGLAHEQSPVPAADVTPSTQASDLLASEPFKSPKSTIESVDICFGFFSDNTAPAYFQRIARLGSQVADALEYAHQHGVLHRDIKPSNLMIDRGGDVWIMDFGLVKIIEQQDLTQVGEIVGTLRYMAPEQLEGRADVRTDVYGLGLTLFELLTLKPAFDGDEAVTLAQRLQRSEIPRPRSINSAIPQDLETIVLKATAREPFDRYPTAAMLAEDLKRFCEDRPILARRSGYLERLWRWSRRNPALAAALGSSAVLLGLVAIVTSAGWYTVQSALRKTESAQRRAEANLEIAIRAFDRILGNVSSRGMPHSLAPDFADVGLTKSALSDADGQLLGVLLEFYRTFAGQNADNVQLRERTAEAHRRAGAILVRLGRLSEAEEDFETAKNLLLRILTSDPHNVRIAVSIASLYNDLGEMLLRRGEFRSTQDQHLEARLVLLNLPSSSRADPSVRFELARATDLLASIDIRSGNDAGPQEPPARPPQRKPRPIDGDRTVSGHEAEEQDHPVDLRPLETSDGKGHPPDEFPDGPPPERPNKRLERGWPDVWFTDASPVKRLALILQSTCNDFRELVSEFPDNTEYEFRLAQCLRHQLVHAASNDNHVVARDSFLEATAILNGLKEKFPLDPKFQYELADTLTQASRAESDDEARKSLETAVSLADELVDHFKAVTEYQLLRCTAMARLAAVQATTGQVHDAKVNLQKAIELLDPIARQFPDQGVIQIPLAKTRQQLGDLLRMSPSVVDDPDVGLQQSRKELELGVEGFEAYLSLLQQKSKSTQKGPFNSHTRSSLYSSLAETLAALNLPEKAKEARSKGRPQMRPGAKP